MQRVTRLETYEDDHGNRIEFDGVIESGVRVKFIGSNNRMSVASEVRLAELVVDFDCDNGVLEIGQSRGVPGFRASIRIGQDSRVTIGRNVSATTTVTLSATEGSSITVGDDVMFASSNQVRADDGHPIFDVQTGQRVNPSRPIVIDDHVWVGYGACILSGSSVGAGSVIGMGSIVKGVFPNNCIIAGVPARVVKRDIAWERPHLSMTKPYYKPDATTIARSPYWSPTEDVVAGAGEARYAQHGSETQGERPKSARAHTRPVRSSGVPTSDASSADSFPRHANQHDLGR